MNSKKEYIEKNLELIKSMISENRPKFEIARILGVKYDTLNKYLSCFGVEYSGNQARKGFARPTERKQIEEYLKENGPFIGASKLRQKLIESGLKEEKCELCGNTEWLGKKIPLELHHINMNHFDNRLDNLQILCSNCHMVIHGYSNVKKDNDATERKKSVKKNNIEKKENNSKKPEKEILYDLLCKNGFSAVGRIFGVTDNAIRKWCDSYGIPRYAKYYRNINKINASTKQ